MCFQFYIYDKNNISVQEYFIKKINDLTYPVIVKPSMLGSSIGIKKVNDEISNIKQKVVTTQLQFVLNVIKNHIASLNV